MNFEGGIVMKKLALVLCLILILSITITSIVFVNAEEEIDFDEKLSSISEEEKRIVEELFIQLQEIEGLERDYIAISEDIEELRMDVGDIEIRIQNEEEKYNSNLNILEEVLRSYQRMGPASYLEIILESNNISDFLRRINVIRDLAKNTGDLLDSIDEIKATLVEEKQNLYEKLTLIEERQRSLKETLDQKNLLVKEQEEYLRSLEADREYYEMYLNSLADMMVKLEDLFDILKVELPGIISSSNVSLDELNPTLSLQGIKLTISEDLFNQFLGNHEGLPAMEFEFDSKNIIMTIGEYSISLIGDFSIYENHSIEFIIHQVRFYDFVLEEKTVKDLIGDSIIFDFERVLNGSSIKDVKIIDNSMELTVNLKIF